MRKTVLVGWFIINRSLITSLLSRSLSRLLMCPRSVPLKISHPKKNTTEKKKKPFKIVLLCCGRREIRFCLLRALMMRRKKHEIDSKCDRCSRPRVPKHVSQSIFIFAWSQLKKPLRFALSKEKTGENRNAFGFVWKERKAAIDCCCLRRSRKTKTKGERERETVRSVATVSNAVEKPNKKYRTVAELNPSSSIIIYWEQLATAPERASEKRLSELLPPRPVLLLIKKFASTCASSSRRE